MTSSIASLPLTPLLYGIGASFSIIVALSSFVSYRRSKNKGVFFLSLSFLFIALHGFSLSVPAIISPYDEVLVAKGYILGMVFLFALLLAALRVEIALHPGFFQKHNFIINTILVGIGITVVWLEIADFQKPIINEAGIIFWNVNRTAAWLTGITCLVYGLIWADFFQQMARLVRGFGAKGKMYILSIDGILLGIAALLVFTSSDALLTLIGHSLFVAACGISLAIFFLGEKGRR